MKPLLFILLQGAWLLSLGAKPIAEPIQQLLGRYCLDCHDSQTQKGELDLARFTSTADIAADAGVWENVRLW